MPKKLSASAQSDKGILIVGGYGQVGFFIAQRLAPLFPDRVSIAGRNIDKAKAASARIGYGVNGRAIDIFSEQSTAALDGVALVVVCLDQNHTHFVEQCLSRGIHYVDISAEYDFQSRIEKLDSLAKQNSATAMLSVGVAPGLTNMLAARVHERMEHVEQIDILIELGLGDQHGQAALEWMIDNLSAEFEIKQDGRTRAVKSFGDRINISLPGQKKNSFAYRFNFSDQHVIASAFNLPNVSTWLRFDNRFATFMVAKLSQTGLSKMLKWPLLRKAAIWLFMNVHIGSDICGVAARASGRTSEGAKTLTLGLIGNNEAQMTAIVAAETARQVFEGDLPAGVLHSNQAIALDPVISALKKELPTLQTRKISYTSPP